MEISENRTVRINLKKVVEDILYSHLSGDEDGIKDNIGHFEYFITHCCEDTKKKSVEFIMKMKIVQEHKFLGKYFEKFSM